ncbi:MAG: SDR family oxidoreductase [Nitrospirota bacterium]
MTGLHDRTVLITGAGRGIGASIAKSLAAHGASVIINYLQNREKAEQVLNEIKAGGGKGIICQADVRDISAVRAMVNDGTRAFGRIDVLINNANINFPIKPFIELTWEEIETKISGELKALYNCSHAVLEGMIKRKSGKLIFISSGLSRHPGFGFSAHAAAKAAMDGISKIMAMELGQYGINVNVIGPGLTRTDATSGMPEEGFKRFAEMTPLRRVGEPADIAGAAVFLASSLSDYLTGQYIPVNGGSFMI